MEKLERVKELWVFPVKSMKGISVKKSKLTVYGLEYDRSFCVIDLEGTVVAKNEAISARKISSLLTIKVEYLPATATRKKSIRLSHQSMETAVLLPLEIEEYVNSDPVKVEASGRSTTTDGGWSFGFIPSAFCSKEAQTWINKFLNSKEAPDKAIYRNGKRVTSKFGLVRMLKPLKIADFNKIFPILKKLEPEVTSHSARGFSDFAPILLTNTASKKWLDRRIEASEKQIEKSDYPIGAARGSIIVNTAEPWIEETWKTVDMLDSTSEATVRLRKLKECPRCTIPCRSPKTAQYLWPHKKTLLWKILRAAFPNKATDYEWGNWAGVFFGVYFGFDDSFKEGCVIAVGDEIKVIEEDKGVTIKALPLKTKQQPIQIQKQSTAVLKISKPKITFLLFCLILALLLRKRR